MVGVSLLFVLGAYLRYRQKKNDKNRKVKQLRRRDFLKYGLFIRVFGYLTLLCLLVLFYLMVQLSAHLSQVGCRVRETHSYLQGGNFQLGMASPPSRKWLGLAKLVSLSKLLQVAMPLSAH